MRRDTFARTLRALGLVAAVAMPFAGCTQAQTTGKSPSYLIIESLTGSSGAEPDEEDGVLASDVITMVSTRINGEEVQVPTIYEDLGNVTFRLGLKDPGSVDLPNVPSTTNFITVNRYRVQYIRADGRNTPGVDVPYPFDGAVTATVAGTGTKVSFTLVRIQAKVENPLVIIRNIAGTISTIAEVTFYGFDQAGNAVSVTGRIGVDFSNWGDPQ
jgi:hypothetical protein